MTQLQGNLLSKMQIKPQRLLQRISQKKTVPSFHHTKRHLANEVRIFHSRAQLQYLHLMGDSVRIPKDMRK